MNIVVEQKLEKINNPEIILVIDDSPTNQEILYSTLSNAGYEVLAETDGLSGIEQAKNNQPDLILLDVMMPRLDGFETCKLLQADLSTKNIPVIFITSLSELEEKIKGLTLGAVDYITKPFQQEEVLARIQLHLKLRRLTLELDQQKQLLEKRVQERTAELTQTLEQLKKTQLQLIQSEKIYSLGQVVNGITHEVNNPIGLISTNLYYANNYVEELINLVKPYQKNLPHPGQDIEKKIKAMDLEHILKDLPKLISSMKIGTDSIRGIIHSLQNLSRMDGEQKKAIDIHEGIEIILMLLQHRLKAKPKRPAIQVIKEYGNLPKVECYPGQLNQVFMNLLVNAIDSLDESTLTKIKKPENLTTNNEVIDNPSIRIVTCIDKEQVTIIIANNGLGMSEELTSQIFQPFFSTQPKAKVNGLGLSISYQILTENHGGNLQCISSSENGTEFIIQIPVYRNF